MIRPCIVIPVYNNESTIRKMVDEIILFKLPVIIVNDGSNEATTSVLREVSLKSDTIYLVERGENGGKGAAVMDGMREAGRLGFSHSLQIDGDNQHKISDIPKFIDAAQNNPNHMILGEPVFPENTPKGRLIGRQISIIWVTIEILGRFIRDPLFGFRVYPVGLFLDVIRRYKLPLRMDFDLEIVVKMYWAGADVVNIKTPVTYYDNGVSSFRMFWDNVAISWSHTKLFMGMLIRFPLLVLRWFKK